MRHSDALARMAATRRDVIGVGVDCFATPSQLLDTLRERLAAGTPFLVTFVNPAAASKARRDPAYREALRRFSHVLPDGIGVCLAVRLLGGFMPARISFDTTSLAPELFAVATERGLSVALVGGREGVAARAAATLQAAHPGLRIVAAEPGYGALADGTAALLAHQPDIVICGMGIGRQEQFLLHAASSGWTGWGFTCGGYLDQLAGGIDYYPRWVDQANLRFLYRLYREPRRLWRRYCLEYGEFAVRVSAALAARPLLMVAEGTWPWTNEAETARRQA